MPSRLLNFGRKPAPEAPKDTAAGSAGQAPAASPANQVPSTQARAALELSQELIRGVEHFVISTPDLDAPGFLNRLRRVAARLTGAADPEELKQHRGWAVESLSAFGQLQRRYLSEREDELWRLLTLYQDSQKVEGAANKQFNEALKNVHERMGNVVRLDDLRQVRERLENEIHRASTLVEQKSRADDERATALSAQVAQLEAALVVARDEAQRDAMTGVYNRGALKRQIESAASSPTGCALAMIDVDNFKDINDTLGHLVGDHILKVAVQILSKVARPGDVLGRYGGDEFCLLSPGSTPQRLSDRFEGQVSQRLLNFQLEERLCSVRLSMSVGIAGSAPNDTADTIIQRADAALYEVKRGGKGHVRVANGGRPEPVAAGR